MNSEIIERALHLSDNNEYVAVERLLNGDFNSSYGDLRWVRGTNTSIFLSCYYEDGQWKLMAKMTQFRKGFVPMMETVDTGILSLAGTNNTNISGFPPSKIKDSGNYATQDSNTTPFDVDETERELRFYLFEKPPEKCNPIGLAYLFMRIKQWYGSEMPSLGDINVKETECYTNIKSDFANIRKFYTLSIAVISDSFDRYRDAAIKIAKSELDYEEKIDKYLAIENMARAEYELPETQYAPADLYDQDINRNNQPMLWLAQSFNRQDPKNFFSRSFAIAMFATEDKKEMFDGFKAQLNEKAQVYLERSNFREMFFELAIDITQPPAFQLTDTDKEILKSPISIVLASTTKKGVIGLQDEENIIDSIAMGQDHGQVDVIYVRSQDVNALREVLSMIHPPLYMKIRVDDTIF